MFTRIPPAFVTETAQSLTNTIQSTFTSTSTTISSKLSHSYPGLSKNLNDNYSTFTNKFTDNYSTFTNKFTENYSTFSSSFYDTRSTITSTFTNGTTYIYSLPTTISSYTSLLQPVDDSEEREIRITSPNDNLSDGVVELSSEREEIINNILELYSCKPSKECFDHYDDDVIFDDPFMYAVGLPNLKAQFYGMAKVLVKSTTVSYKILQNGPDVLKFDLNQKYVLPFVNRAIVQNSQITLELDTATKKIIKHVDRWNGKSIGKEGMFRKGAAKVVSSLIWVPKD